MGLVSPSKICVIASLALYEICKIKDARKIGENIMVTHRKVLSTVGEDAVYPPSLR